MKVYITYDRYEHNEWFYIYQVTHKLSEVIRDYKKNLKDFISYGPDDCHSYQIQIVNLPKERIENLKTKDNYPIESGDDLYYLMEAIYKNCDFGPDTKNCLLQTDGSDNFELVDFWIEENNLDPDEVDRDELESEIFDNVDLYNEVLNKYIDKYYII